MPNRFEQVDEAQDDAITLTLEQRTDGQWATVRVPAKLSAGKFPTDTTSASVPPADALAGAVKLANELKLAIVVVDRDALWKPEWGTLYRWEDEPEAQEEPDGGPDAGPRA